MSPDITLTLPPRAAAELLTAITNHTMNLYDAYRRANTDPAPATLGQIYRASQRRRAARRALDIVLAACGGPPPAAAPELIVAEVELTPGQAAFLESLSPPGEPPGYWLQHAVDEALDQNGYVPEEWEPAEAGPEGPDEPA